MSRPELYVVAPMRLEARAARAGTSTVPIHRAGVGARRARRAGAWARDHGARIVLVTGFCGAADPRARPGDVVLATEIRGPDGVFGCADPTLLAASLRGAGLRVHVGPLASTKRPAVWRTRGILHRAGVLAADMESAWLAQAAAPELLVTMRVVVDTPAHELRRPTRTVRALLDATRTLRRAAAVAEEWSAALGDRDVRLAGPRASCAGVVRAVDAVRSALTAYGAPLYVRKQIVHNARTVAELEQAGAVFVAELDEVPRGATVVFSAHGVSPAVREEAARRELTVIDATCPLVAKVHGEARRFAGEDFDVLLIGHQGHEEVEGTSGEAPQHVQIVGSVAAADEVQVRDPERVAYLTQTTLAVDETKAIVDALSQRFPALVGPKSDDICYATQNRQDAVRALAAECELILVVGSANSSNSQRLVEVAGRAGCPAQLIDGPDQIPLDRLAGVQTIGITAGASAPEVVVQEVVRALGGLGPVSVSERVTATERLHFKLPPQPKPGA